MSISRQLWIGLAITLITLFIGTVSISFYKSVTYLEEQLFSKNIDNANVLGFALSASDHDPEQMKLAVQAHFDLGHYREIKFTYPDGRVLVDLTADKQVYPGASGVPTWFRKALRIESKPGIAALSDGWKQLGTLEVISNDVDVYNSLWKSLCNLLEWFAIAFLIFGLLGFYLIKTFTKSLTHVVNQANALGERRFILSPMPKTAELKVLVTSMNRTTKRIRRMLKNDTSRIEQLRQKVQLDQLTGLLNREFFIHALAASADHDNILPNGFLFVIKLDGLDQLNKLKGWHVADEAIKSMAAILKKLLLIDANFTLGRLGGGDFVLTVLEHQNPQTIESFIRQTWDNYVRANADFQSLSVSVGIARYGQNARIEHIIEASMSSAITFGDTWVSPAAEPSAILPAHDLSSWQNLFDDALAKNRFDVDLFPIVDNKNNILHYEASVRMMHPLTGFRLKAGVFLPWSVRTNHAVAIDVSVLNVIMNRIRRDQTAIALNLSGKSLQSESFAQALQQALTTHPEVAHLLHLDINLRAAIADLAAFKRFCNQAIPLGCKIGLEHVGLDFSNFAVFDDVGLHYIKVHPAVINGLRQNAKNQIFASSMIMAGRSLGAAIIAEGVSDYYDIEFLFEVGFDGVTGSAIRMQ